MHFSIWFILLGIILVFMAIAASLVQRLPLTASLFYLSIGFFLGPAGMGAFNLDPIKNSSLLERLTEISVIISLFTAGLKLRIPILDPQWKIPLRLAFVSLTITVALITAVGVWALKLPLGAAVLLGAILAPTDPVLASDVQVKNAEDRDPLRFGLTGEAGFNDGSAFPFVMLGLGLLGLHPLGEWGWRWFLWDLFWGTVGGLVIGGVLGTLVARLVIFLRQKNKEAVVLDDFLALGLIAISYGTAIALGTYGFLAVFAAGLALRRVERSLSGAQVKSEKAPAKMAQAVLRFNEQLERIGEVAIVLLLGGMLTWQYLRLEAAWFVPVLFFIIRPMSVYLGLWGAQVPSEQKKMMSWFGIRGIGSLYYLMFALQKGLPEDVAAKLISATLLTVTVSILAHGISVTPLMNRYSEQER